VTTKGREGTVRGLLGRKKEIYFFDFLFEFNAATECLEIVIVTQMIDSCLFILSE